MTSHKRKFAELEVKRLIKEVEGSMMWQDNSSLAKLDQGSEKKNGDGTTFDDPLCTSRLKTTVFLLF